MTRAYRAILEPDADTIRVECPSLPELNTFGEDERDALHHAVDAAETVLHFYMVDGEAVPPSDAGPQDSAGAGAGGGRGCYGGGRLGWHREQVERLFRLNHASRLEQLEAAFAAVGCVVDVQVRRAA